MRFLQGLTSILLLAANQTALAKESNADMDELDRKLANPLADLTTIPFQFHSYSNDGDAVRSVFNFQPLVSANSERWLFINRFILPYVVAKNADESESQTTSGFGDFTYQLYVCPRGSSDLKLGAGLLLSVPTGIDERTGSGRWGIGPTAAIVKSTEDWTMGALLFQNWSFAGDKKREDVNLLTIQPVFSYSLPNHWRIGPFDNITYDATLDGEKWTIPLGLQMTKLLPMESAPVSLSSGIFSHVVHPDDSAEWGLKLQLNLVL